MTSTDTSRDMIVDTLTLEVLHSRLESIIEVASRDEALMWAARIARSCRCAQEVREIMFDAES